MEEERDERTEYYEDLWNRKLRGAFLLRDYAITNNLPVPDDILKVLQEAEKHDIVRSDSPDIRLDVDKAIRDLTSVTFPTTIETLLFQASWEGMEVLSRFRNNVVKIAILALVFAMIGFFLAKPDPKMTGIWGSLTSLGMGLLGISLGLLGATVYVIFSLIGEWTEKVMSPDDPAEAYLRLLLGPLVGWVFFFAFAQEAFAKASSNNLLLLLPFLAGFSTKLVVCIIQQALQAIQITLGLEDKGSRLLARKAREKQKMQE